MSEFMDRAKAEAEQTIDHDITWHSPPEWQAAYQTIQELEWLARGWR